MMDSKCTRCGAHFTESFAREVVDNHFSAGEYDRAVSECGTLCSVCATGVLLSECEEADDGERISVYDAAEIWASSGKDEDETFGYTVEELEAALKT